MHEGWAQKQMTQLYSVEDHVSDTTRTEQSGPHRHPTGLCQGLSSLTWCLDNSGLRNPKLGKGWILKGQRRGEARDLTLLKVSWDTVGCHQVSSVSWEWAAFPVQKAAETEEVTGGPAGVLQVKWRQHAWQRHLLC